MRSISIASPGFARPPGRVPRKAFARQIATKRRSHRMDEIVKELVEICPVDELEPGQTRIVDINNRSIGVFNVSGNFFALANLCPHAGGPLCRGQVTGTSVADKPYAVSWQRAGEIVRG